MPAMIMYDVLINIILKTLGCWFRPVQAATGVVQVCTESLRKSEEIGITLDPPDHIQVKTTYLGIEVTKSALHSG